MKAKVKMRKILNADSLIAILREEFGKILDHRKNAPKISLSDCLMSGLAIFALKYPSLLSFDTRKGEYSLRYESLSWKGENSFCICKYLVHDKNCKNGVNE